MICRTGQGHPPAQRAGVAVRGAAAPSPRHPSRSAAAVVEFAIIVPFVFLLVFGMIEFGRMLMVEQMLTNAAREGCRRAVMANSTTSDVQTIVNNYLSNCGITGQTVAVSPDPNTAVVGDAITVTVSIPFNQVGWLPTSLLLGNKTLSATVVMRKESNNT